MSMNTSTPTLTSPRTSTRPGSASVAPNCIRRSALFCCTIRSSCASCDLLFTPSAWLASGATQAVTGAPSRTASSITSVR